MDITTTDEPDGPGWANVAACTLPTAERPLRLAQFDELFTTALRSIDHISTTRTRLLLAGDRGLAERTRRLADAESSCCSFFSFAVTTPAEGLLAVDIEVPPTYTDVLAGLVARARAAMKDVP